MKLRRRFSMLCGGNPSRPGSPEPPPHPITRGIDSILTASCLPDEHPHSIHFPEKKPSTDFSIIRSPSLTEKIKGQLRSRASSASLRYDNADGKEVHQGGVCLGQRKKGHLRSRSSLSSLRSLPKSIKQTRVDSHHDLPVLAEDDRDKVDGKIDYYALYYVPSPFTLDGATDGAALHDDELTKPIPEERQSDGKVGSQRMIPRLHEMRISQILRPLSEATDRSTAMSPCPSSLYSRQPSRAEANIDGSTDEQGDYERNLTITGDDRRRRSTINLNNLQDIREEESRTRNPLGSRISRAKPLMDDGGGLMAEALVAHQEEKAMFRSASKQRESLGHGSQDRTTAGSPVFSTGMFIAGGHVSSSTGSTSEEPGQAMDSFLSVPGENTSDADPSSLEFRNSSRRRASSAVAPNVTVPAQPKRIGTWLASWARYPSHTRPERCGSAGSQDDIVMHDFGNAETSPEPGVKRRKSAAKRQGKLATIWKYYAEVLTTGNVQNRRTSVTTGGWLEQPDLEMLRPRPEEMGSPAVLVMEGPDEGRGQLNGEDKKVMGKEEV